VKSGPLAQQTSPEAHPLGVAPGVQEPPIPLPDPDPEVTTLQADVHEQTSRGTPPQTAASHVNDVVAPPQSPSNSQNCARVAD
jgi:hypothetical protein